MHSRSKPLITIYVTKTSPFIESNLLFPPNWTLLLKILCNTTVPLKQLPYQRSQWCPSANTDLPPLAIPCPVNTYHTSHLPGHEQKPHKLLIQSSSQHQYRFPLWEHRLPTFCHLKTPQSCRALWLVHVQCASSVQKNISVTTMSTSKDDWTKY